MEVASVNVGHRHLLALHRAFFACIGATLAMLHIMLAAFLGACAASFGTDAANVGREFCVGAH